MRYELTKNNLAYIGVLDDFYQLYTEIKNLYSMHSEELKKLSSSVDKKLMKDSKIILNEFFKKHTRIFTNEFMWLHPNTQTIQMFHYFVLDYIEKDCLKITIQFVGFSKFLKVIQKMASELVYIKLIRNNVKICQENAYEKVNNHILMLVDYYKPKVLPYMGIDKDAIVAELITFNNLSSIICNREQHNIIPRNIWVEQIDLSGVIRLPVHYCEKCNKYFIGIETLNIYQKEYGKLLVKVNKAFESNDIDFSFLDESDLHKYGYNVLEGGMTEKERQELLVALLNSGRMTFFDIRRDIHFAIKLFKYNPRFNNAVEKWKKDLYFISEFQKSKCL